MRQLFRLQLIGHEPNKENDMREAIHYVDQVAEIFSVTQGNGWPEDAKKVGALLDQVIKDVRADYEEASRQIGELHASQIESWEGEVKELEDKIAAMSETARLAIETEERLLERIRDLGDKSNKNAETGKAWMAKFEDAEKQNDALLEDLHRLTVENAELRGYAKRVREFDPLSERELQDRAERPMVPFAENRRSRHDMDVASIMGNDVDRNGTQWFRRRPL